MSATSLNGSRTTSPRELFLQAEASSDKGKVSRAIMVFAEQFARGIAPQDALRHVSILLDRMQELEVKPPLSPEEKKARVTQEVHRVYQRAWRLLEKSVELREKNKPGSAKVAFEMGVCKFQALEPNGFKARGTMADKARRNIRRETASLAQAFLYSNNGENGSQSVFHQIEVLVDTTYLSDGKKLKPQELEAETKRIIENVDMELWQG